MKILMVRQRAETVGGRFVLADIDFALLKAIPEADVMEFLEKEKEAYNHALLDTGTGEVTWGAPYLELVEVT